MHTTDTPPVTTPTCDPRPYLRHMTLAIRWCQWNGQRGTARQYLRVMHQCTAADLERMLAERGVSIEA